MDERYKWNLTDIYEDTSKVDEDFNNIAEYLNEIVKLKGSLKESSDNLLSCYNLLEKAEQILDVSNAIIVHDLIKNEGDTVLEMKEEEVSE